MARKRKPARRQRGSGSVSFDKKRDRWRAVHRIPGGTRSTYHASRAEAITWLDAQAAADAAPATPTTLRDALLNHLVWRSEFVRADTTNRESLATARINATLGDLPLTEVATAHIATLDRTLRSDLAGGTVRGILSYLSSFYDRQIALETPGILRNPVRNYRKTTPARAREGTPSRKPVALDYGMCRRLLAALADDPYHPHVAWLLTTGMRVGELRGLRWVNVQNGIVRIVEQRTVLDRHTPAPLKTERQLGEGRIIPLPSQLLALTPRDDNELVFPHSSGVGSFDENALRRHLEKACTAAKVPRVTIHDLRHTANSGWADLGLSESGCAALLGHRKQTTTARYTHRSADALRPFVDEWAGLVLGENTNKARIDKLG